MNPAITVMAFTVVLAEAFAAVGLSTLAPAMFVQFCRVARAALIGGAANLDTLLTELVQVAPRLPGLPQLPDPNDPGYQDAIQSVKDSIIEMLRSNDKIQLLVPKTATIDAEFSMGGSESASINAGVGGMIKVVNVNAGFSALFELHSSTTVRLHVDFAQAEYTL